MPLTLLTRPTGQACRTETVVQQRSFDQLDRNRLGTLLKYRLGK